MSSIIVIRFVLLTIISIDVNLFESWVITARRVFVFLTMMSDCAILVLTLPPGSMLLLFFSFLCQINLFVYNHPYIAYFDAS